MPDTEPLYYQYGSGIDKERLRCLRMAKTVREFIRWVEDQPEYASLTKAQHFREMKFAANTVSLLDLVRWGYNEGMLTMRDAAMMLSVDLINIGDLLSGELED